MSSPGSQESQESNTTTPASETPQRFVYPALDLTQSQFRLLFLHPGQYDDEIHADALTAAVRALDETGVDVAMLPYRYRRGPSSQFEGMNVFDVAAWARCATSPRRVARLDEVSPLLGFSSYPWNKVLRTDHYRRSGLRFGGTPVHNDVLGHWLTLLDAGAVLLLDQPLCTHIVAVGGRNLTR